MPIRRMLTVAVVAAAGLMLTLTACTLPDDSGGTGGGAGGGGGGGGRQPAASCGQSWHKIIRLAGATAKRSPVFPLGRCDKRLTWTLKGDQSVLTVYLVKAGHSLQEEGGFPEVSPDTPGTGSTMLANPPGRYYLDVTSANGSWAVQVAEQTP